MGLEPWLNFKVFVYNVDGKIGRRGEKRPYAILAQRLDNELLVVEEFARNDTLVIGLGGFEVTRGEGWGVSGELFQLFIFEEDDE